MDVYVKVEAGFNDRSNCPVTLKVKKGLLDPEYNGLRDMDGGGESRLSIEEEGEHQILCWVIDHLEGGRERLYVPVKKEPGEPPLLRSEIRDDKVELFSSGNPVTEYYFGSRTVKPYLGPLDHNITRLDFNTKEHPHHRSIWFSHGDVNGVDFWNEPDGSHGRIINKGIFEIKSTHVFTSFKANNLWTDFNFNPMADDVTFIKLYNTGEESLILDLTLTLKASYGDIILGRTKEAGPVAIRVSDELKAFGTLINAYGKTKEEQIWMKRAPWCGFTGRIKGRPMGISIFDSPGNYGYPSYWHGRKYGLIAPNNFYIPGSLTLKKSEEMSFSYRIVTHMGEEPFTAMSEKFNDYINPPGIELLTHI